MREKDEEWAAFWCGLLFPLLHEAAENEEVETSRGDRLRALAAKEHRCPDGKMRRFSVSTLRRRLKRFREERLHGLLRRRRSDRGRSRRVSAGDLNDLITLKRELPIRSADTLAHMMELRAGVRMPRSTIYRHLKAAGATRIKLGVAKEPVRCRFTRDHCHELWIGDFEEGPTVVLETGAVARVHLSAFIDCHSRLVVAARYYLRQNLPILEDTLLRGFAAHGSPLAIYVDNAKVYHSKALNLLCAETGIRLLHRKVRDPQGGGLIERFFRTVQDQFESEVRAGRVLSLTTLNEAFAIWLDSVYHRRIHSETGATPLELQERHPGTLRPVDMSAIHGFFLQRHHRTVDSTFADVRVDNRFYRVDASLRGDRVEVRTDPFGDGDRALVFSLDGQPLGEGRLHQREQGEMPRLTTGGKVAATFIDDLLDLRRRQRRSETEGIDYRRLGPPRRWPLTAFLNGLARAAGRQAGLSAFDAGELEALRLFWERHSRLDAEILQQAIRESPSRSMPALLETISHLSRS
jgi:transposase InsO family protein